MLVRWYCAYSLSYRDIEELAKERGLPVDHSTINRWVICYAPQLEQQFSKKYKREINDSWRMDETYLKIKGEDVYLISYKGVLFTVSMYNDNLLLVSGPKSIWWVKIKNKKGQIGWTKLNENFDDMDACG